MSTIQIIMTTISSIILIPALIWSWLNHKAKVAEHEKVVSERDLLTAKLAECKADCIRIKDKSDWFRALFDSSSDMVLVYGITDDDQPTKLLAVNDAACEALEYNRKQLLDMTPLEVETIKEPIIHRAHTDVELLTLSNEEILAQDSKYASRNLQHLIKRVRNNELVIYDSSFVTQTEHCIPVEITAQQFGKPEDNLIVCTVRDISERKKAALALRESEQRFKDFFASSPIGVATYTSQHTLINVNLACLRIFGSPGKGEFEKLDMFNNRFLPNSAKENISRGQTVHCEVVFDFDELLKSHNIISSRRGKAYFEILFNNMGVDHEHNPLGYLIQVHDITERREVEAALQLREAQLRQAQKMEAIGTMAGGIAHDFNNILTPILGYSDIGMELLPPEDRMHSFMKEIKKSTMRAKDLVHQILLFSRQSEESQTLIHLIPIVKEVAKQQSAALPKNITVTYSTRIQEDLVLANPTQIHQVLTNFCTNAAYAMKTTGGSLDVRLTLFAMGWRHRQEFPQLKKGRYIRISVKDTGCGISQDVREKIFDPFFSTKPSGEGTGMGLSVVHGIISSLGGGISLVSEEGKGSTFHVALPLSKVENQDESTVWVAPQSDNERILFVDDEQGIAKMATHMLTSLGYEPIVTSSSLKALDIFEENPKAFDLLITDQVMPELTGSELAIKVRALRPDMPVIICSGFSGKLSSTKAEELGVNEFLVKPISRRELGEAIQRVIGGKIQPPTAMDNSNENLPEDESDIGDEQKDETP